MVPPAARGATLLELLVALLLIEAAGVIALHAALRLGVTHRGSREATVADLGRAEAVALRLADSTCRSSGPPWAGPVVLAPATGRPARTVLVRCGR